MDVSAFLPILFMVGAFLVGAVVIALVQRWRRRNSALSPTASDQLAQFRTLYEQGAISEEEYRRLRNILGGELRRAVHVPAPPAAISQGPAGQAAPPPDQQPPPDTDPPPASGIRPA